MVVVLVMMVDSGWKEGKEGRREGLFKLFRKSSSLEWSGPPLTYIETLLLRSLGDGGRG